MMTDSNDLGNHRLENGGISAYGLIQAVNRYEDYGSRIVAGDQPVGTRRAFRAFMGERETEKQTARDYIVELTNI